MSDENEDELKQAYAELDAVLRRIVSLEGLEEGVLIDWVALGAVQASNDDGEAVSLVVRMLPERGAGIPYYRVIGLLETGVKGLCMDLSDDGDDDDREFLG